MITINRYIGNTIGETSQQDVEHQLKGADGLENQKTCEANLLASKRRLPFIHSDVG